MLLQVAVLACQSSPSVPVSSTAAAAAAPTARGPQPALPRFLGIAYSDLNLNASAAHNIIKMAEVSTEPWVGHMDKHKGWIGSNVTR